VVFPEELALRRLCKPTALAQYSGPIHGENWHRPVGRRHRSWQRPHWRFLRDPGQVLSYRLCRPRRSPRTSAGAWIVADLSPARSSASLPHSTRGTWIRLSFRSRSRPVMRFCWRAMALMLRVQSRTGSPH